MKKLLIIMAFATLSALQGCNMHTKPTKRGEPVLLDNNPVEDSVNQSFSLTLSADSVAEASVDFFLIDCNDTLMTKRGQMVTFTGIAPLNDGYDVVMKVEWPDTIIMRSKHVIGFILTPRPIEQMTKEELQKLINDQDKSIRQASNDNLSQSVNLIVKDALRTPQKLSEVIECISFGEWSSVKVEDVGYDENNRIASVTLKPIGEKPLPTDDKDEDDEFVIYDD